MFHSQVQERNKYINSPVFRNIEMAEICTDKRGVHSAYVHRRGATVCVSAPSRRHTTNSQGHLNAWGSALRIPVQNSCRENQQQIA